MDIKKILSHWLDSAKNDIKVACHLFEKKDFLYSLFFGHLYLEKILKALIVKNTKKHAPFTHDLEQLYYQTNIKLSKEQIDSLHRITSYNISARYPEDLKKIKKKFTKVYTHKELNYIKDIGKWLITKLK